MSTSANPTATATAIDPVCGMTVGTADSPIATDANGAARFFCSQACRELYQQNPGQYAAKRRSWWYRYLKRVKKATGGRPMSCCD